MRSEGLQSRRNRLEGSGMEMIVHLGPQHIVRKLGVVGGIDAGKVDLLDPIVERRLARRLHSLNLRIPQNLTLGRNIVGHQCLLELVPDRCHLVVGCATEKDWVGGDSFYDQSTIIPLSITLLFIFLVSRYSTRQPGNRVRSSMTMSLHISLI